MRWHRQRWIHGMPPLPRELVRILEVDAPRQGDETDRRSAGRGELCGGHALRAASDPALRISEATHDLLSIFLSSIYSGHRPSLPISPVIDASR